MARNENPPFGRGETWPDDGTGTSGAHLEGKEFLFEDKTWVPSSAVGAKPDRTARYTRCRIVRNVAAAALLPKRLAKFKISGVKYGSQVDGYACVTAERGYPVDEFLPSAGVAVNDLFYIVVDGPATVLLPLAGSEFNGDIAEGQMMVALTAATSGATTAGRVAVQNITGSSQATDYTFLVNQIQNAVGRALSAKTTGNTNADLLVEVGKW